MGHNADSILIRARNIGLMIAVLTLLGMVLGYAKKPFIWDQTTDDVKALKPVIWATKSRVDVIEARQEDMLELLRGIKREVSR